MKFFRKILLGVIIIYVIALMIDIFISRSYLKSSLFDDELKVWNTILNKELKEKDILIFGSSRAMVHINPKILYEITGESSFNLGFNGQRLPLIKYRLEESLNYSKPRNVILVLDNFSFQSKYIFKEDQLAPLLLFNKKLYDIQKNNGYYNIYDVYIPLIRYSKNKEKHSWLIELYKVYAYSKQRVYREEGYRKNDFKWTENQLDYKYSQIEFEEHTFLLLQEIINKCKHENINLILVTSPTYKDLLKYQVNNEFVINKIRVLSQKNNIIYKDYSKESRLMDKKYFANSSHLNSKGADIFTKKLAEDIKPYLKR